MSIQEEKYKYGLDFKLNYNPGDTIIERLKKDSNEETETAKTSSCNNEEMHLQYIGDFESIDFGVIMTETSG